MKNLTLVVIFCLGLTSSCDNPRPNTNVKQVEITIEPKNRGVEYYKSKGFQIFPQYHLALKCPVILTDISTKSKANFDFHYGGVENNESFYEMIVIDLPLGYKDLSTEEKIKFEQDFLSGKFQGKTVVTEMGGQEINAKVMEYTHQRGQGKGFAFIFEGKTFAFNVIAKERITERFNSLTNNIVFYPIPEEKTQGISSKTNSQKPTIIVDYKSKNKKIITVEDLKKDNVTKKDVESSNAANNTVQSPVLSTASRPKVKKLHNNVTINNIDEIELLNLTWEDYDPTVNSKKLKSLSVYNKTNYTIGEVLVSFEIKNAEGIPINSGELAINSKYSYNYFDDQKIKPNSAKEFYCRKDIYKLSGQRLILTIEKYDIIK